MVLPLIPLALIGAGLAGSFLRMGANLYSQNEQRKLFYYQKGGYERALADWNKNVGSQGRSIRYPELSYEGKMRALDTGISQSYASSVASIGSEMQSASMYGSLGAGLYSSSKFHSSRWL